MRKKVFKTLVAVLALAAVTGPVRGQTVPDVEYNLRGIPQGWTATANGNNVTVTDGKTAPIDPASPVSLTPRRPTSSSSFPTFSRSICIMVALWPLTVDTPWVKTAAILFSRLNRMTHPSPIIGAWANPT